MRITLYGSATAAIDDKYKTAVTRLGQLLAWRGHSLIFGGGGNGLMGAAAQGVSAEGGKILGIIPEFFDTGKIEKAYPFCTALVRTETMHDRKELMEQNADGFIITPGGIGTFDEFFSILTNKQLGRHDKPIAIYNIDGYFDELEALLAASVAKKFVRPRVHALYKAFTDPEEMLDYIEAYRPGEFSVSEVKEG